MLERNTTVSIIVPTYNRAHLLSLAIESVLVQTYRDFELIVVDDSSTDNTLEVVKNFGDGRIYYFKHETNQGAAVARNTGIAAARGRFVAFLDSDDEWLPEKLQNQLQVFETTDLTNVGLVYTGIRCIDYGGNTLLKRKPMYRGRIFDSLLGWNVIGTSSTALVKADCFRTVGLFDESLPACQDLDLWIRIAKEYDIDFVSDILTLHRIHKNRITEDYAAGIRGMELLSSKFHKEYSSNRKARALHYYDLGHLYFQNSETSRARNLLKQSITTWPFPKAVALFCLFLLGRNFYRAARRRWGWSRQ